MSKNGPKKGLRPLGVNFACSKQNIQIMDPTTDFSVLLGPSKNNYNKTTKKLNIK
jgi:hypothetical protein